MEWNVLRTDIATFHFCLNSHNKGSCVADCNGDVSGDHSTFEEDNAE